MGHTFTNHLYHITFSTAGRRCYIKSAIKDRLFQYMCGTARKKKGSILKVNGVEDHIHVLAKIAPDIAVSKFVGEVKGNASKWVSGNFPAFRSFTWQEGFASFTVSESNADQVAAYIDGQTKHHGRMSFVEELTALLEKHGIEFDPERDLP